MNKFVKADPMMCIGCRTCMIGCVVAHKGLHIFQVDPDSYTFNPKLHMVKTRSITAPVQCKHCENPACMAACPNNCFRIENGAVILDTDKCIGCKQCMTACPFGAIDMVVDEFRQQKYGLQQIVANKCDLCQGNEHGPECVFVCPTQALKLVVEEDAEEILAQRRIQTAAALNQKAEK